jgi:hypothetical protein
MWKRAESAPERLRSFARGLDHEQQARMPQRQRGRYGDVQREVRVLRPLCRLWRPRLRQRDQNPRVSVGNVRVHRRVGVRARRRTCAMTRDAATPAVPGASASESAPMQPQQAALYDTGDTDTPTVASRVTMACAVDRTRGTAHERPRGAPRRAARRPRPLGGRAAARCRRRSSRIPQACARPPDLWSEHAAIGLGMGAAALAWPRARTALRHERRGRHCCLDGCGVSLWKAYIRARQPRLEASLPH